jgi:sugar phosphate isomerase/epimerase
LRLLSGEAMHVLHVNDYPADPPREKITDAMRVYPGDGVAPLKLIFTILRDIGYRGVLSLELFNEKYWKENDAQTVAETGLRKTREAVRKAFA